jgi:hypothetical protein
MYRINLYPEYQDKRRAARRRASATAGLLGLLGLEVLMVGALVLSDKLLSDQANALREELPQLTVSLQTVSRERPELDLALELLAVRTGRIDWSPMLAALADSGDKMLTFVELKGESVTKHRGASLVLSGEALGSEEHLEQVAAFMERLRRDERLSGVFGDIALGNIRGGGSGEFDLICQPVGVK